MRRCRPTCCRRACCAPTAAGADTPFTDRMLAENFIRIALYDEYHRGHGGPRARRRPQSRLRRWEQPVRVGLRFGASVPPDRQATDRARIASLPRAAAADHRPSDPAVRRQPRISSIYIVTEDERHALGPAIRATLPGPVAGRRGRHHRDAAHRPIAWSTPCPTGNGGAYTRAFAVIRAEHPDLLRLSCIHEEIAQGLGLPTTARRARPSIFNDDEEFALLTPMDELMLQMLYSPAPAPRHDRGRGPPHRLSPCQPP